jgi:hypothetical protein
VKASVRFTSGNAKAEAGPDCSNTGQNAALTDAVETFVHAEACALDPGNPRCAARSMSAGFLPERSRKLSSVAGFTTRMVSRELGRTHSPPREAPYCRRQRDLASEHPRCTAAGFFD